MWALMSQSLDWAMGAGNEMAENVHRPIWSLTVGTPSNLDFIRIKLIFDLHLSDPLYLLTGSELRVLRRGILFINALEAPTECMGDASTSDWRESLLCRQKVVSEDLCQRKSWK